MFNMAITLQQGTEYKEVGNTCALLDAEGGVPLREAEGALVFSQGTISGAYLKKWTMCIWWPNQFGPDGYFTLFFCGISSLVCSQRRLFCHFFLKVHMIIQKPLSTDMWPFAYNGVLDLEFLCQNLGTFEISLCFFTNSSSEKFSWLGFSWQCMSFLLHTFVKV